MTRLRVFLLLACALLLIVPAFASEPIPLDRNEGTSQSTSSGASVPDDVQDLANPDSPASSEGEELYQPSEVKKQQEIKTRSSLVDTVLYMVGIMFYAYASLYASMYVAAKLAPVPFKTIVDAITFKKFTGLEDSTAVFVVKILLCIVVGVLFANGYIKIFVMGWYRSIIQYIA